MFDNNAILKDSGAVTSTGNGTVGGEAKVLEVGDGLVQSDLVLDVDAIAIKGGPTKDNEYQIHVMGGSDSSFTEEVSLAALHLGSLGVIPDNIDCKEGQYILPFRNEKRGRVYSHIRVKHVIAGTASSINYNARLENMYAKTGVTQSPQTVVTTTTVAG
jgi:hypothetical protein